MQVKRLSIKHFNLLPPYPISQLKGNMSNYITNFVRGWLTCVLALVLFFAAGNAYVEHGVMCPDQA
jgi:hypothetical protein